ncbi:helix-turn-helix domain-containing protein [Actinoplanes subglobosus]|uniref:Multiprotein-bridging factor 1 family protein n=1 Tax=Actinoplanes subglobosus TaxID=1547892 RepID=A0ABV8IH60_9ACTN
MTGSTESDFGSQLRNRRVEAGVSLAALSRSVHYSKSYLSKVENGLKVPSVDLARRCDAALGADGELAALVPDSRRATAPPAAESAAIWALALGPDGRSEFSGAHRPGPDSLGVATTFSWRLRPAGVPRHTQESTVPSFEAMFGAMRRLGQTMSPAALIPILVAQTNALRVMANGDDPAERGRILVLAARYAEYAGWMAQEAGNDDAAMWWTDQSCELAESAGFSDLAAYALVRQALVTMYRYDARNTITLARLAQEQTHNPRIAGLAAQREAQGHALANDSDSCWRALERARILLGTADEHGDLVLGTATLRDPVTMVSAWCLHDLGRPREAVDIFAREIDRIPPTAHRSIARYSARYALALAASGEMEQACLVAEPVLEALTRAESATIKSDLRQLASEFRRAPRNPVVRNFIPRLADALRS